MDIGAVILYGMAIALVLVFALPWLIHHYIVTKPIVDPLIYWLRGLFARLRS